MLFLRLKMTLQKSALLSLMFLIGLTVRTADCAAQSVNLGTPPVLNFPKKVFQGGPQTWDIDCDAQGILWFANNQGLLEYDGAHWRIYPLPNSTIARSVRTNGCQVFVGGQDEMGFFRPDARGILQYHSLTHFLPDSLRHFGDVWDVEISEDGRGVYYRADHYLFQWDGSMLRVEMKDPKGLLFLGKWQKKVLIQDSKKHFWTEAGSHLVPHPSMPPFEQGGIISGIAEWTTDTLLITTIKDGIFAFDGHRFQPWRTNCDDFLREQRIMCAVRLPNGQLALGTALDGVLTIDRWHRSQRHIDKKHGLQNNTVLSLAVTAQGNVWMGLDNGIDYAALDAAFSVFYPDGEQQGTGYAIQQHEGQLYFGTNTGLFALDWQRYYSLQQRERFVRVRSADGQVWSLNAIGHDLLMGHHEGAFRIRKLQAERIASPQGIWKFLPLSPDVLIAGYYEGLLSFRKEGDAWKMDGKYADFSESSRLLAMKDTVIWMAHPYRGVYRIVPYPARHTLSVAFMGRAQQLPSDLGNQLFQLQQQILFTGSKGVFQYDPVRGIFVSDSSFIQIFGSDVPVYYLSQDKNGHIWYQTAQETGVLLIEAGTLKKKVVRVPIPELKKRLTNGFQCIYPVDSHNVFVATDQGFLHFDLAKYRSGLNAPLRITLHEVRLTADKDSVVYGGHAVDTVPFLQFLRQHSTLSFHYASPDDPDGTQDVRYAYWLEGSGQAKWSEWRTDNKVSFDQLSAGNYVFKLKACNQYGVESRVICFRFRIVPPWYADPLAYVFYALLFMGAFFWLQMRQHRRFEREKQTLQDQHRHREAEHQQEVLRSEAVITQLQEEKLRAEIEHKTEELASMAMHLVQKNAILQSMQESLERLKKKLANTPEIEKEIARIARMIGNDLNLDEDWTHFSQNFDQVHRDFLKRLGEKYPTLSPSDYKLCAYLRLNLTSKEIATLMNISLRGVETGRYRLRKRLHLGTEVNLTEFLMQF